ncbi:MAG: LysR substrate-binding domain-containing protein [Planctomycetia bacterium]|jgi:LysR family hydrogen peroxide-inducible transcriptional activator
MARIDLTAVSLSELRYFVALCDEASFSKAAQACGVSQPTLSEAIRKLEATLKVPLVERGAKQVEPTAVGAEVCASARAVLDGVASIGAIAERGAEPLSGTLSLGVIPSLAPYLLPWLLPALRRRFPRLKLVFRELKTQELLAQLSSHDIDAGILALPVHEAGIAKSPIFDEPFLLLVPEDHRLAARKSVKESDLDLERVLLLDEGHCLRDQALEVCRRAGADTTHEDFRATSLETLRHMVAAGMGVTLLPALAQKGARARTVALPFAAPAPTRRMALCWRKSHPRPADHLALARFLREEAPEGVKPPARGA